MWGLCLRAWLCPMRESLGTGKGAAGCVLPLALSPGVGGQEWLWLLSRK